MVGPPHSAAILGKFGKNSISRLKIWFRCWLRARWKRNLKTFLDKLKYPTRKCLQEVCDQKTIFCDFSTKTAKLATISLNLSSWSWFQIFWKRNIKVTQAHIKLLVSVGSPLFTFCQYLAPCSIYIFPRLVCFGPFWHGSRDFPYTSLLKIMPKMSIKWQFFTHFRH